MLIDIAFFVGAFFLAVPGVTGYFAYCHGRSFWLWFTLGCFLPVFAHILLAILCRKTAAQIKNPLEDSLTRYEDEYMQDEIKNVLHSSSGNSDFHFRR
jgi:membrane protein implicated in regulation of membrane protease activity